MKNYITLRQLLRYFDGEDDTIQICYPNADWEDFDEVSTTRGLLLEPFLDWYVQELGIVHSEYRDEYVPRVVLIEPKDERKEPDSQ